MILQFFSWFLSIVLAAITLLRKRGSDAERLKQLERIAERRKIADEIRAHYDSASADELERMRREWTRQ